ncbi:MAG: hypothetical protein Q4G58_05220 [bacterium]|nr:hypothetical protein [bacterium]
MFRKIGYYLVEEGGSPKEQMPIITATDCICNLHPKQELLECSKELQELRLKNRLTTDRRFQTPEEARKLYNTYLKNNKKIHLISISIKERYLPILKEEMEEEFTLVNDHEIGSLIGYDLLGWDIVGFHSYLCNGLEEAINRTYHIQYNKSGLIENKYEEVKEFAKLIQGQGEPVEWFPFKVEQYQL